MKLWSLLVNSIFQITVCFSLCINCSISTISQKVEPEFKSYYQEYLYLTNRPDNGMIIKFGNLTSKSRNVIGICNFLLRSITIDREYWKTATKLQKKALIWHELGHCDLFLNHKEGYFNDMCPKFLMNPYIPSKYCLKKYWEKYKGDFQRN